MKFCGNCGKKIKSDVKFCPYCGAKQTNPGSQIDSSQSNQQQRTTNSTKTANQQRSSRPDSQYQQTYSNRDQFGYTQRGNTYQQPQQSQVVQPVLKRRITPPQCSFVQAFKLFWTNYVNFSGYSSRSEFWWWFLIEYIIDAVFLISSFSSIAVNIDDNGLGSGIGAFISSMGISVIWYIAILLPNLSLRARRFRDAGISTGWTVALLLIDYVPAIIPFVGWLAIFIARVATLVIECMPSVRKVVNTPR